MRKRNLTLTIILTIGVILVLTCVVGYTIRFVNERMMRYSFRQLNTEAEHLAGDLYHASVTDSIMLSALASMISVEEPLNDRELCEIMQTCDLSSSYITYIQLLKADDTVLLTNGAVLTACDWLRFDSEKLRGRHISEMLPSRRNEDEMAVYHAVPVVKDGKTLYILYGVIELSDLARNYRTNIYDGSAYVYLEDGETGDLLLDTWHTRLGNINQFQDRVSMSGKTISEAIDDMRNLESGCLSFISQKAGEELYMSYAPVGINDWNVIITVEKEYALREGNSISALLYIMAMIIAIVLVVYMGIVCGSLMKAYRNAMKLGTKDQTTMLQNRNAYDRYINEKKNVRFDRFVCIYIDANGLHRINNEYGHAAGDKLLYTIAESLKNEFAGRSIYRVGGDEYIVLCENMDIEGCRTRMERVTKRIEEKGYSISYGIVYRENEVGISSIAREADEQMLENKRQYYLHHKGR